MIGSLERAICESLAALPGVATARPYAGELGDTQKATLQVPALLVALARLAIEPDPGSGEVLARAEWSCFVCVRQARAAEARGAEAWALTEAVLVAARANTWGVAGCSPAVLMQAAPLWHLEERALAVREVRWTQLLRLGVSEWLSGIAPSEIYLGIAPRIGEMGGTVDDYWPIAAEALPT